MIDAALKIRKHVHLSYWDYDYADKFFKEKNSKTTAALSHISYPV